MKPKDLLKKVDITMLSLLKVILLASGVGAALTLINNILGWALLIPMLLLVAIEVYEKIKDYQLEEGEKE